MSGSLPLFDSPDLTPNQESYGAMKRCWLKFAHENPRVWDLYQRFAAELLDRRFRRYSSRLIIARIRWHVDVDTAHEDCELRDSFKINDHHSPFYGRLWTELHPEHAEKPETTGRKKVPSWLEMRTQKGACDCSVLASWSGKKNGCWCERNDAQKES